VKNGQRVFTIIPGGIMIKKYGDIISATVFLAITGIYYAATFGLNTRNIGGNALVPRLVSLVLGICCFHILTTACVRIYRKKNLDLKHPIQASKESPADKLKVVSTLLLISGYAIIFPLFGFIISTPIYLLLQIYLLIPKQKRRILPPLITAIIVTAFIYVIFTYVFFLVLPSGSVWYTR
jgi:hypothetical protein